MEEKIKKIPELQLKSNWILTNPKRNKTFTIKALELSMWLTTIIENRLSKRSNIWKFYHHSE